LSAGDIEAGGATECRFGALGEAMMVKLFSACAAAGLLLAGCATGADLKGGAAGLVGKPLQVAIDRLGPPTGKTDDGGGQKTVFWMSNYDVQYSTSAPPNRLGIGDPNQIAGGGGQPGATTTAPETSTYRCFVRVTVGPDNLIETANFGGNSNGCASYANRLK
jgi:hypothetical protein